MADSPYIFEVNADNFEQVVIEGSSSAPVLVDFWADWCNPCRMLMPVLAKLAQEYNGQFILAKVNSDANQELSARYGVRSLPTVKLFKNGQPVDEFMGALPESAVREFLDKHIERESDKLCDLAAEAQSTGDHERARALLQQANTIDPGRPRVITELATLLADGGEYDKADELLQSLPADERAKAPAAGLLARMGFVREAADFPAIDELREKVAQNPDDLEARHALAIRLAAQNDYREAMDQLLEIMRKDRGFRDDLARKTLLKIFDLLGNDPLVAEYRRKMANLLY